MTGHSSSSITFDGFDEWVCSYCGTTLNVAGRQQFTLLECTNCHKTFPVPAQLGPYVLLDRLGQGGMGAVYKGFDPKLKRPVAVKVMNRRLGGNEEFTSLFLREAQILASLNNPHVVQVYNFGEKLGQPYMIMELVDGGRFDQMIKQEGTLQESFVVNTAMDIVNGLHAAASMGLVHGDMKPENILFDRERNAKVVDFGLARFKGEEQKRPGEIWGTPYYIAPEVVRGKQANLQADIYSLGCVLYEALAGHPPFSKDTVQETVLARFKETPPDLRILRPDIHPETVAVVMRMLEVDLFRRYPNYDSLLTDMNAAAAAVARGPVSTGHDKPVSPALLIVTILTVIACAGFALFLVMPRQKPAPPPPRTVVMKVIAKKPVQADATPAVPAVVPAAAATSAVPTVSVLAIDNAGGYFEWTYGMNGGTGFGPWILQCGSNAGFFVATSTDNSSGVGGIDTRGKSWGMFAHSKGQAGASRMIAAGPLAVSSQRFTMDFDNGKVQPGGYSTGWGLQNAASNNLWEFYYAGDKDYTIRDGSGETGTGIRFTANGLHFEFKMTSTSMYEVSISANGVTNVFNGKLIETSDPQVRIVHVWNYNTGPGKDFNVYFNNMRVLE